MPTIQRIHQEIALSLDITPSWWAPTGAHMHEDGATILHALYAAADSGDPIEAVRALAGRSTQIQLGIHKITLSIVAVEGTSLDEIEKHRKRVVAYLDGMAHLHSRRLANIAAREQANQRHRPLAARIGQRAESAA